MKKILVTITSIIALTSCSKYLEQKPISSLAEEDFYRNTVEVEAGVIGCYAALRDVYNLDPILAGLRSDDAYISVSDGDINQVDAFNEVTTNSYVSQYWQNSFFVIKQCNTVLKYLNNVTDPAKKIIIEGEAKFLRAHMYFNLVRLFGDVPLVLKSVEYNSPVAAIRIDKNIVYDSIVADFTDAINKLPASIETKDIGRVSLYAAKGMLAKVYLTTKKYPEAKTLLWDLLQNAGQYNLLTNYKSIFGVNNETNNEIMYSVRFKSNTNGIGNTFTFNMDKLSGSVGYRAASDFRGNTPFPTADSIRKTQTFLNGGPYYGTSWYCGGKYLDPGSPRNDGGTDFIVLRYADIIMMYAEVENEINGNTPLTTADLTDPNSRLFQLNRIRTRAAGPVPAAVPTYVPSSSSVNSKANFLKTIKAERRREFGMEDQRWFDLLRWDDAITAMNTHFTSRALGIVVEPYQALYPIPQREIDISQGVMKQNPGYN